MKIIKNDEAVSPVIGVILMVAITVILAAVIAAFVFGMAGTTTTTKTVGIQVTLGNETDVLNVMFTGGADLPALNGIYILQSGEIVDLDTADDVTGPSRITYTVETDEEITWDPQIGVGEVTRIDVGTAISGTKITVNGKFSDGSTQILYDRTL